MNCSLQGVHYLTAKCFLLFAVLLPALILMESDQNSARSFFSLRSNCEAVFISVALRCILAFCAFLIFQGHFHFFHVRA